MTEAYQTASAESSKSSKGGNGDGQPAEVEITCDGQTRATMRAYWEADRSGYVDKCPLVWSDDELDQCVKKRVGDLRRDLKMSDLSGVKRRGNEYILVRANSADVRLSLADTRSVKRLPHVIYQETGIELDIKEFDCKRIRTWLGAVARWEPGPTPAERLQDLLGEYLDPHGVCPDLDKGLRGKLPVVCRGHLHVNIRDMARRLAGVHSVVLTEADLIDAIRAAGGQGPRTLHHEMRLNGRVTRYGVHYWCVPLSAYPREESEAY